MKLGKNKDYIIYTGLFLSGWSLVLLILLGWNFKFSDDTVKEIALYKLRSFYSEVLEAREWSIRHGGVFLAAAHGDTTKACGDSSRSKWFLAAETGKNNSVSSSDNKSEARQNDMRVRITNSPSSNPLHRPDSWEKKALDGFEKGESEAFLMTNDNLGRPVFRYIAPLKVDYTCIACHNDENFLLRKFNGAISITAPAEPLIALRSAEKRQHMFGYGFVWLLGCAGIVFAMRKLAAINEQRIRHEKFVGVMEMAGAAAHELNQPLQVISGCTEIMLASEHRLDRESRALSIRIKQSVDKLASITRKINHITRYVTTEYTGQTRIIDLEKAAPKPEDEVRESKANIVAK